jgi:hypothetical protein
MKNVLYTALISSAFLYWIISFANKIVTCQVRAEVQALNDFESLVHGRKAINTCSEMITPGFSENIVYK